MKASLLVAAVVFIANAGWAYLTKTTYVKGDTMCHYDNGTVINAGYKSCATKIKT